MKDLEVRCCVAMDCDEDGTCNEGEVEDGGKEMELLMLPRCGGNSELRFIASLVDMRAKHKNALVSNSLL
jgi:hypothetical protein